MRRYFFALVMLTLVAHGGDVRSAPLDADGCAKLKGELTQLEQSGARANLAKGADWGKMNLAPGKLEEVKRLIEVDEQLLFRCNGKPLVLLPEGSEPDLTGGADTKAGTAKSAPKAAHKKEPTKKAAAEPPAKAAPPAAKQPSAAAPAKTGSADAPKAAAPKPKPKEKVNDAYQPPRPADPAGDPFSRQLQAPAAK